MPLDFDALTTQEQWAQALQSILAQAKQSSAARDQVGIDLARDQLKSFIDRSPVSAMWSTDLDNQARAALLVLIINVLNATVQDIESRTVDLQMISKAVAGLVEKNKKTAADIQHEKLSVLLIQVTATAKAAKDLQAAAQQGAGGGKLAASTAALLEALEGFSVSANRTAE